MRTEIVEISSDEEGDLLLTKNGRTGAAGTHGSVQQNKKAQVETATFKRPSQTTSVLSSSPPKGPPRGHSKQESKTFPSGSFRPSTQKDPGSSKSSQSTKLQVELVARPQTSANGLDSPRSAVSENPDAQDSAADGGLAAVINGQHGTAAHTIPSPVNPISTPVPSPPASPAPSTTPESRPASATDMEGFPYTPLLSIVPLPQLTKLTEEEARMTVEQWIRREIERECEMFKEDAERQLAVVREKAARMRKVLEAL